jgi:hypothetical protein
VSTDQEPTDPTFGDVVAVLAAEVRDRAVRLARMIRLTARPR